MKKIVMLCGNKLPVPAVHGGAVETLIEDGLLKRNEILKRAKFVVISAFDIEAQASSKKYENSDFIFIKPSKVACLLDSAFTCILKLLKSQRTMSYGFMFRTRSYYKKASRIIKQLDFDCLVEENSIPVLRAFLKSDRHFLKQKVVYHAHSIPKRLYGVEGVLGSLMGIITVSDYVTGIFGKIDCIESEQTSVKTLFNAVDLKQYKPIKIDKECLFKRFGIPKGSFVILFVGRICAEKGIGYLVEAFKRVSVPNKVLLIVGNNFYDTSVKSPFESELRGSCLEIKDRIVFTGYVKHDQMPAIYAISDVVCLPSDWGDPCPLTVFEALACGKALVTTNDGGIPEIVGDSAIVIDTNKDLVSQLKESIESLQRNPAIIKEYELRAREQACKFDLDNYLDDFITCVEELK